MSDSPDDIRHAIKEPPLAWGDVRKEVNHGDKAYEYLAAIKFQTDEDLVDYYNRSAHTHALLYVGDKIDELIAAMRSCTASVLDSQATLNEDIKTAARYLHADAKDLKAHLRVVRDEDAA